MNLFNFFKREKCNDKTRRTRPVSRKATVGALEMLEGRQLFSVSPSAPDYDIEQGKLHISGTDGNDTVEVERYVVKNECEAQKLVGGQETDCTNQPKEVLLVRVEFNGQERFFALPKALAIHGGNGDDTVKVSGLDLDVTLRGGLGNDKLEYDGSGKAVIRGGAGNDVLKGGWGDDLLDGGRGNDMIDGHKGDDLLCGSDGDDSVNGGEGDDKLFGGRGRDELDGQEGHDRMFGGGDSDKLKGGVGRDRMHGGDGDDSLEGGEDADVLRGGRGRDSGNGDGGKDRIFRGKTDLIIETEEDRGHLSKDDGEFDGKHRPRFGRSRG